MVLALSSFTSLAALLGCDGGIEGEYGPEIWERGDTTFVANHPPEELKAAHLIPKLRIGTVDGDVNESLMSVQAIGLGPGGRVFVAEGDDGIKEFDSNGRYLRHLARKGEGPKEVRWVNSLSVRNDGTVAVYDLGNNRISVFHTDNSVSTFRRPDGKPDEGEHALMFHNDGSLWVGIHPWFPRTSEEIGYPRPVFARLDEGSGELVDTVFAPKRLGEACPLLSSPQFRAGFWEDKREPWFPKGQWALGPTGTLAFGCPATFSFELVKQDGQVIRVSRPWRNLTISKEEREFYAGWQPMPSLPDTRPAYARIVLPGDGRVWVWPNQPGELESVPRSLAAETGVKEAWRIGTNGAFEVFGEDGVWLGRVELPAEVRYSGYPNTPPILIRGDTVLSVAQDSLGVEYVVRFEVVWKGEGYR